MGTIREFKITYKISTNEWVAKYRKHPTVVCVGKTAPEALANLVRALDRAHQADPTVRL